MKTKFLILFLFITLSYLCKAQIDSSEVEQRLYETASNESYRTLQIDTVLKFDDGFNTYFLVKTIKYRSDTILSVNNTEFKFEADTLQKFSDPKYSRFNIPVIPIMYDTIFHPEDNSIITAIDTIDSIPVRYGKIYNLSPSVFFQTIKGVESLAESQDLNIELINITFFNRQKNHIEIGHLKGKDFDNVEYAKANFLFEQNGNMMTYPILFIK